MLKVIETLMSKIVLKNYSTHQIAFSDLTGSGVVLAGAVGADQTNREYAVWTFDHTGSTFSGFYSREISEARNEFRNRIGRI